MAQHADPTAALDHGEATAGRAGDVDRLVEAADRLGADARRRRRGEQDQGQDARDECAHPRTVAAQPS